MTSKKTDSRAATISRKRFIEFGLGAGVTAGLANVVGCAKRTRPPSPNIILISLDTTRADHLSCYGYDLPTSPKLDLLADESLLYTEAISSSSWTLPAHATLFTGKFVSSHGARYDPDGPLMLTDGIDGPDSWKNYRARGLSPDETTLAAILRHAGYSTGAVVGGPWMKRVFGLHEGFDYYDDSQITTVQGRAAHTITTSALKWVDENRDRPFFLFLNYFDPHTPYAIHKEFNHLFLPPDADPNRLRGMDEEQRSEVLKGLYDAEIRYMDLFVGVLLDRLKELDLYDRTLIIVVADHGELLGEHGQRGHGGYLYQEELHVPVFAKYPFGEVPAGRTDTRIQLTDVMPMVLERLDISMPVGIQGSPPSNIQHPIVAEVYPLDFISEAGDQQALFDGPFKLVISAMTNDLLFDLHNDPDEMNNLFSRHKDRAQSMEADLLAYLASLPRPAPVSGSQIVDEATREALESLGYL